MVTTRSSTKTDMSTMEAVDSSSTKAEAPSVKAGPRHDEPIPTYRIDLSLPPQERYVQVATEMKDKMQSLTSLFDEVLQLFIPFSSVRKFIQLLASIFLQKVYSKEETQELKGIAKASGVDLYFLVALNVVLDSLLGCTSGAVMTSLGKEKKGEEEPEKRLMHFRTLDWEMDGLKSVLVTLEFVRSKSAEPEKVIARSITYAGFLGVLTGVRENLSVSLNFRPNHISSTLKLRLHQLGVLFGVRPSVTTILRQFIIPPSPVTTNIRNLMVTLGRHKTAPCYLVLCDGELVVVLEKDYIGARIHTSKEFIVHTNHDTPQNIASEIVGDAVNKFKKPEPEPKKVYLLGMEEILEESVERRECIEKKWKSLVIRREKKWKADMNEGVMPKAAVGEKTLRDWVGAYPTMNECTHFGCIMDPKMGEIRFSKRGNYEEKKEGEEKEIKRVEEEREAKEKGEVEGGDEFTARALQVAELE